MGAEASVILVSDHGFRAFAPPDSVLVDVDAILAEMGLLRYVDPALPRKERRVNLALSASFSSGGTGIVDPLVSRIHWIYLNPSAPDAPSLDDLVVALRTLESEAGERFFREVRVLDDLVVSSGVDAPDIAAVVSLQALQGGAIVLPDGRRMPLGERLLYQFADISGTHRPDAVLVVKGPGVARGSTLASRARPEDVASIVLRLAGAPLPSDLDGSPPRGLFPRASHPSVISYEELIPRERVPAVTSSGGEKELLERLRSLGYVR
jgi:hypothetical protein